MQDFPDVISASSEYLGYVRPIRNETAGFWKHIEQGNKGEPFGYCKLADLLRSDEHEGGRQQDTGINMLYPGGLLGTLEVIRNLHFHNFSFERERPHRRLGCCELSGVEAWDAQPHDVLEDNAAGGQRARFPVERWRVKTAPRVRCPAPGLGMPLVGSGVLRLAQQFRQLGDVGGDTPGLRRAG